MTQEVMRKAVATLHVGGKSVRGLLLQQTEKKRVKSLCAYEL